MQHHSSRRVGDMRMGKCVPREQSKLEIQPLVSPPILASDKMDKLIEVLQDIHCRLDGLNELIFKMLQLKEKRQ